jgi:putative OPT family oligopeptide transporter
VAVFKILRGGTILEGNMVQTIGSAGESLAAGVIFTLAGLYIWKLGPTMSTIFVIAALGGLLGVLFMIPLRRLLIVREHGRLPYPEGAACAEVLVAGQRDASKVKTLVAGLGIGALYQTLMHGKLFGLWGEEASTHVPGYHGAEVGAVVTPELLGVGFIIGPRIAAIMFAGGALGWLVIIPMFAMLGEHATTPLYPATTLIKDMAPGQIWSSYLRYIGAGAVAVGGFVTLLKSLPMIWSSFALAISGASSTDGGDDRRTNRDLPMKFVVGGVALIALTIALLPDSIMPAGFLGAILMVVFAFFFVTVSSRIVGLIGSSSNPVSGMTIATLLVTALIFVALGKADMPNARFAVLAVGAVVCIAAAIAGDTSQDLKTGFLVGATPRHQQIGEVVGVLTAAMVMGFVLNLLDQAYGIGSAELAAPQATIMTLVIDGVLNANLPWNLVIMGGMVSLIVELLGLPSLALAVGLYLPLSLSVPIVAGGAIRGLLSVRFREKVDEFRERREAGILYCSGLIAGAALIGVFAAGLVAMSQLADPDSDTFASSIGTTVVGLLEGLQSVGKAAAEVTSSFPNALSLGVFLLLASSLAWVTFRTKNATE